MLFRSSHRTADLAEAVKIAQEHQASKQPCAVAYHGNIVDLLEYVYDNNIHVDLLSDQTSCHVPYDGGYCPQGLTFEERTRMLDEDPEQFAKLVDKTLQHHYELVCKLHEGKALGAVAAVVGHMAGGLIAEQVHVDVVLQDVLQQVHHVAVIGHGTGLLLGLVLLGDLHGLGQIGGAVAHPALGVAGLDLAEAVKIAQEHQARSEERRVGKEC